MHRAKKILGLINGPNMHRAKKILGLICPFINIEVKKFIFHFLPPEFLYCIFNNMIRYTIQTANTVWFLLRYGQLPFRFWKRGASIEECEYCVSSQVLHGASLSAIFKIYLIFNHYIMQFVSICCWIFVAIVFPFVSQEFVCINIDFICNNIIRNWDKLIWMQLSNSF